MALIYFRILDPFGPFWDPWPSNICFLDPFGPFGTLGRTLWAFLGPLDLLDPLGLLGPLALLDPLGLLGPLALLDPLGPFGTLGPYIILNSGRPVSRSGRRAAMGGASPPPNPP